MKKVGIKEIMENKMKTIKLAVELKLSGLEWEPEVGDTFAYVDCTLDNLRHLKETRNKNLEYIYNCSNIFHISGEHRLDEKLGGRMLFFGGGLYAEYPNLRMNKIHCSCMNKTGFNPNLDVYDVSSWERQLWIPDVEQMMQIINNKDYHWKSLSEESYGEYSIHLFEQSSNPEFYSWCYHGKENDLRRVFGEAVLYILQNKVGK